METLIIVAMIFIPLFIFINVICLIGEFTNRNETKRDKIEGVIFCIVNIIAFSVALFL